jgi:hypothetical protein
MKLVLMGTEMDSPSQPGPAAAAIVEESQQEEAAAATGSLFPEEEAEEAQEQMEFPLKDQLLPAAAQSLPGVMEEMAAGAEAQVS